MDIAQMKKDAIEDINNDRKDFVKADIRGLIDTIAKQQECIKQAMKNIEDARKALKEIEAPDVATEKEILG